MRRTVQPATTREQQYLQLVQLHQADLYRYACWLCKNPDTAADVLQDTFLRAWKSLDNLQQPNSAKAWLFTILRHENARRFERRQLDYQETEQELLPDEQAGPEQCYEQQQLLAMMQSLDVQYSEPLVLQLIGGFSGDEIAQLLNLNLNTVNTRLFRARKQLRERLEPQPGELQIG
ncbi:sigma-70 family RNA polymerase sigma factor [Rheinheimera sp.]|uniref:sigma-70 family RNA polymerase sigma factor n=1 Tax=Rheinheimera sp. TaxID=1869214 RepID=UPI00307E2211